MNTASDVSTRTHDFFKTRSATWMRSAVSRCWFYLKSRWLHLQKRREHRRAIAHLSSLDDKFLKDIGLSRSQIEGAVKNSGRR